MDAPLINVGGPDMAEMATAAEAISLILTTAGDQRTPESVQLEALRTLQGVVRGSSGVTIANCHFVGEKHQ